MIKLVSTLVKLVFFCGVVLVLGSLIRWNGKTVSDQIKTGVSKAEKSPWVIQTQEWVVDKKNDLLESSQRQLPHNKNNTAQQRWDKPSAKSEPTANNNHPTYSERQKLRTLIQELNTNSN